MRLRPNADVRGARNALLDDQRLGTGRLARLRSDAEHSVGDENPLHPGALLIGERDLREDSSVPVGRIRMNVEKHALSGDEAIERRRRPLSRVPIAVEIVCGDDAGEPHFATIGKPERRAVTRAHRFKRRGRSTGKCTGGPSIGARGSSAEIRQRRERQHATYPTGNHAPSRPLLPFRPRNGFKAAILRRAVIRQVHAIVEG